MKLNDTPQILSGFFQPTIFKYSKQIQNNVRNLYGYRNYIFKTKLLNSLCPHCGKSFHIMIISSSVVVSVSTNKDKNRINITFLPG